LEKNGGGRRETGDRRDEAGLTLIELLIAGAFVALAACGLSAVLVGSMAMGAVNKETAQARAAAQQMLEQLHNIPAGDVYATFNQITSDDPYGTGSAPGSVFSVRTKPSAIQVSNMIGEVLFPDISHLGELREDTVDPLLGMPRDLNGDGSIDTGNHAGDYMYLPVRVRITWSGIAGERSFEVCSVLLNK
jgi:hypothetical protein